MGILGPKFLILTTYLTIRRTKKSSCCEYRCASLLSVNGKKRQKNIFFHQGLKIDRFLKFHPCFLILKLTDMKTKQKTFSCPLLLDCQKLVFLRESWPKFDNLLNVNFQVYSEGNSEIRERGQKNALIHSV